MEPHAEMEARRRAVPRDKDGNHLAAMHDGPRDERGRDRFVARHHPIAVANREHGSINHHPREINNAIERSRDCSTNGRGDVDAAVAGGILGRWGTKWSNDRMRR